MAAASSGSSVTSSLGRPSPYSRSYISPVDSAWTQTSGVSTLSVPSTSGSAVPQSSFRPLDIGPPGYRATITLFTPDERTVYLGPWDVVGSPRCIVWTCSYQNERLEHYLPSDVPSKIHPHTLHSRHRPFNDPSDTERSLIFTEPHRIRYITDDGRCIHDQYICVTYEFATVDESIRFQSNLRNRVLVNYFDVDVAWSDLHSKRDSFGSLKGFCAIQRLKMWHDPYTNLYSISLRANKVDDKHREYDVHIFEGELRQDCAKQEVHLKVLTRRRSAPDASQPRRFSFTRRQRRSTGHAGHANPEPPSSPQSQTPVDIQKLSIQFSSPQERRRFVEAWVDIYNRDRVPRGVQFPPNHFELPSHDVFSGQPAELECPEQKRSLDPVPEPVDQGGRG